jgi:invasin D
MSVSIQATPTYIKPHHAEVIPDSGKAVVAQVATPANETLVLELERRQSSLTSRVAILLNRDIAPSPRIETMPEAAASTIAQNEAELAERLKKNRELTRQLQKQVGQADGDKVIRAMILQEMQKFFDFAYDTQINSGNDQNQPKIQPLLSDDLKLTALLNQVAVEQGIKSRAAENEGGTGVNSSDDFFAGLIDLIKQIGGDYLEVYERLIEQYSAMFKDFNEKVMAKMSDWIKGVNDGKEVEFNTAAFRAALNEVISKYSVLPNSLLFPVPNADGTFPKTSREDAEKWAKAMGLPAGSVKIYAGSYIVVIDLMPLQTMLASVANFATPAKMDSAKFQAWQTGFNTQEAAMKNYLQVATSKYSNANAYHDNFIKILSSQLSQFADMLKAYLN